MRFLGGILAIVLGLAPVMAQAQQIQDFGGAIAWLNSPPLSPSNLRGKVVLVDFWEYSCSNCLNTLPYLRSWYARYHKEGFVIVGIHSNEFAWTGQLPNVTAAVKRLGIAWPVAVDSRHSIWDRYNTNAWPRELLYDRSGRLIEEQIGEGSYAQIEANIRRALNETNGRKGKR
ncbi:MAG: redoxin family protein [Candidatus Eremiobacteraeota bacterium]|nr:redoxin family protein [Candidatus Eremiobacteraeota bacterium]